MTHTFEDTQPMRRPGRDDTRMPVGLLALASFSGLCAIGMAVLGVIVLGGS